MGLSKSDWQKITLAETERAHRSGGLDSFSTRVPINSNEAAVITHSAHVLANGIDVAFTSKVEFADRGWSSPEFPDVESRNLFSAKVLSHLLSRHSSAK